MSLDVDFVPLSPGQAGWPGLMMHDAGVGLRLRRLSEAESDPRPDPCVPGASLTGAGTGAVSPGLTSSPSASSPGDPGVTPLTSLQRQRSDLSPVGASLQEMYGLVSNRAKDQNEKVFKLNLIELDLGTCSIHLKGVVEPFNDTFNGTLGFIVS